MNKFSGLIQKPIDKEKFFTKNPTLLNKVLGIKFYEHPIYGDEATLVVILPTGECGVTDFWEVPTAEELEDHLSLTKLNG